KRSHGYIALFWSYPVLTLIFLALVQTLLFIDRGAIAAVLHNAAINWRLSSSEQGIISSAFTVGFMLSSPVWAHYAMRNKINKVIALSLLIFSISEICSGLFSYFWKGPSNKLGYYLFVISRLFVGVGESAIIALGYGIVDDISPTKHKTTYMAVLVFSGAVGVALGYGLTGALLSITTKWQVVFFAIGGFVLVCTIICHFIPMHGYEQHQTIQDDNEKSSINVEGETQPITKKKTVKPHTMFSAIMPLAKNPVYLCMVGYSILSGGIICMLAFWSPTFIFQRLKRFDLTDKYCTLISNIGFGLIILTSSVFGSTMGAIVVSKTGGTEGWKGIGRALLWSMFFLILALPFMYCAFIFEEIHWGILLTLFFFGTFFLMAPSSPFQVAMNNSVEHDLRHFANSYQIFLVQGLGDMLSPFLFGIVSDNLNIKWAMIILWSFLVPAIVFLFVGGFIALFYHRRQNKEIII
ncbi:hypothetical protein AKO1_015408, partial [Acrasis kona]